MATCLTIFWRFLKLGCFAWGGPVAQIAMLRRELVEEEAWVSGEQFNRALALYQALPGPEAHELCVWLGMKRGGYRGGLMAGLGFMLPGLLLMLAAIWLYALAGNIGVRIGSAMMAAQLAVVATILFATYRIGKHTLKNYVLGGVAAATLVLFALKVPFYVVLPWVGITYGMYAAGRKQSAAIGALLGAIVMGAVAYWVSENPPLAADVAPHTGSVFSAFVSGLKGGLLTFGGAYTAIPFVGNDAIGQGWLRYQTFLDGVAIANVLPAPLVIFATFVGYFAAGWGGALAMTAGMFLPSFGFTLLGHRYLERVLESPAMHGFLDGVAAGVVGAIAATAWGLLVQFTDAPQKAFILLACMFVLIFWKSKFAAVSIILAAALCGYLIQL